MKNEQLCPGDFPKCSVCSPQPHLAAHVFTAGKNKPKQRAEHFALHIALGHTRADEDSVSKCPMYCGWCGSNKNRCKLKPVSKGKVEHICSNNLEHQKIRKTTFSKWSNKPVICQICSKPVWILNLGSHREEEHPGTEPKVNDADQPMSSSFSPPRVSICFSTI